MDDVDTERGDDTVDDVAASARTLEHIVDPVVSVAEASRDQPSTSTCGRPRRNCVGPSSGTRSRRFSVTITDRDL